MVPDMSELFKDQKTSGSREVKRFTFTAATGLNTIFDDKAANMLEGV